MRSASHAWTPRFCLRAGTLMLALASASVAHAQFEKFQERPFRWHIDAGYSFTTGTTEDFLDDGWLIGFGLTWRPLAEQPWAIRADLHYSDYDATDNLIDIAQTDNALRIDDGDAAVYGLDVNGVYDVPFGERAKGYVTAGIGAYRREVDLTQTVLVNAIFCDPWWGFCYPGLTTGSVVMADQHTTRFAWNTGLGVEFPLEVGSSWFIEARYRRIETSEPTEFIPIIIGFRF